jgi:medium-chain acyl-[acyl-carrier-protein] hydrolase
MIHTQISNIWFICQRPLPEARLRLFCFPYAGGSAQIYWSWVNSFPKTIEVLSLQLPGRGNRLKEASFTHITPLVQALKTAISPFLDIPFAFFGHSMGALIAYELVRELHKSFKVSPVHFFASGRAAPHIQSAKPKVHTLSDLEFIKRIQKLNGTPRALLENQELMNMMLPCLRADFAVCETYVSIKDSPLCCPLTVFGGVEDSEVSREELEAWGEYSRNKLSLFMLPGDHFFLHTSQTQLLLTIIQKLSSVI